MLPGFYTRFVAWPAADAWQWFLRQCRSIRGNIDARKTAAAGRRQARANAAARAALRLDPELAKRLLEPVDAPAPFPGVTGGVTTVFDTEKCAFCLGLHSRKCPAVREIEYAQDGRVHRVAYWEHWDDSDILWREDIQEAATYEEAA